MQDIDAQEQAALRASEKSFEAINFNGKPTPTLHPTPPYTLLLISIASSPSLTSCPRDPAAV
ncbi:hypothetical protein EON64_06710 [archaeon]|nr:MAG: hypothetical protein EON64_06710 [archaeon]